MPESTVNDRLIEAEKRITKLEDIEESNNEKFSEITKLLKNIEKALIGSVEDNSIGIIALVRDYKKEIDETRLKTVNLEKSLNDLLEEYKKYKWYIKGMMAAIVAIVSYSMRIWEMFK